MKLKVAVLGEKPQGATWLKYLIKSNLFDIVAGVPRISDKNIWWDCETYADILKANSIPIVKRRDLLEIDYDIIWSQMYGFIIESDLIRKAKIALNLHESPLPRYRGCNGYSHAILENDNTYGTTLHVLDPELDNGDIIDQELFQIEPDDTVKELYNKTMNVSNIIFKRNVGKIAKMDIKTKSLDTTGQPIRQRNSLKNLKIITESEYSDIANIYRRIRAFDFTPFEPAFLIVKDVKYYLFVNNSLGRLYHVLPKHSFSGNIYDMCIKYSSFIVSDIKREIVIMKEEIYDQYYRNF